MKNLAIRTWLSFVGLFLSASAFAAGPDFSALTDGIDFSTVITGIMAIAAAVAGVYVAWKGVQLILRALKGA